ncbi:MAG: prepilin-type N-terminal cleavage/methylation domain-containing protein [Dissulfurispiraceae bacterium]
MLNKLRSQKGFTLIELSIVLVIIGVILAAVLRGQDLIDNAKAKRVASLISQWEIPIMAHYDMKGYYPGDAGVAANAAPTGLMGGLSAVTNALISAGITYPSPVIGDISVTTIAGAANVCGTAFSTSKNYMVIQLPATATLNLIQAIDTNIDGTALGNSGHLMNCGASGTSNATAVWATNSPYLTYIF